MDAPWNATRRTLLFAAVSLALVAAACTSGEGPAGPEKSPGPTYKPKGQLVVLAGRFLARMSVLNASSGKEARLRLPFVGGSYDSAWPAGPGNFYAMPLAFGQSFNQLFVMGTRRAPHRIGPPIHGITAYEIVAGQAVAWGCPGPISILDLDDPTEWREVANGCSASLSPDGTRLAFANDKALFVKDLPDGEPREVMRFRDLPELRRAQIQPISNDEILWGDPGVAVQVGDASRCAVVVWREDGPPVVHALGRARLGQMRWQPGGRLLAFYDYSPHGEVVTLNPDTGEARQVTTAGDFARLAWSPDGKVVATARSENIIAVVDPVTGAQVSTLPSSGVPIAWLPT